MTFGATPPPRLFVVVHDDEMELARTIVGAAGKAFGADLAYTRIVRSEIGIAPGDAVVDLRSKDERRRDSGAARLTTDCCDLSHLARVAVLRRRKQATIRLYLEGKGSRTLVQQATCSIDPTALASSVARLERAFAILVVKHLRGDPPLGSELTHSVGAKDAVKHLSAADQTTLVLLVALSRVRRAVSHVLWESCWNVGILDRPIHSLLDEELNPDEVRWLKWPDRGSYIADPCEDPTRPDSILVERYDFLRRHGTLVRVALRGDRVVCSETLLDEPHHLSYPLVVGDGGRHWIVPESAWGGEIALYELVPDSPLVRQARLVGETTAADPTLLRRGGKWWLFGTESVPTRDTELSVWHGDELAGPWRPHTANPVKLDVTSARPAGAFFEHDGVLYRPAQINDTYYGAATAICRVVELSTTRYVETVEAVIGPLRRGRYQLGPHTIASFGKQTLIDGKSRRFRPWLEFCRAVAACKRKGAAR